MTESTTSSEIASKSKGKAGGRSPAYPFISLRKALERVEQLKKAEGFYAVPPESAYKAWGFGSASGNARQSVAALKHYGLLDYVGQGSDRKVKLSDLAKRIVLDVRPDSPDRQTLVRQAALKPWIHSLLVNHYPDGLPSDTTIQTFLVLENDFNEQGAKDLIAQFKDTFAFASLGETDDRPPPADELDQKDVPGEVEVGDIVQWEVDGVLKLEAPSRIRAIQEHDGQVWAFLEGSETGLPLSQLKVQSKGDDVAPAQKMAPVMPLELPFVRHQVKDGEQEWLRGPLSKSVAYRLLVTGDIGPREIGKLIRVLEAQREVLEDDDESED